MRNCMFHNTYGTHQQSEFLYHYIDGVYIWTNLPDIICSAQPFNTQITKIHFVQATCLLGRHPWYTLALPCNPFHYIPDIDHHKWCPTPDPNNTSWHHCSTNHTIPRTGTVGNDKPLYHETAVYTRWFSRQGYLANVLWLMYQSVLMTLHRWSDYIWCMLQDFMSFIGWMNTVESVEWTLLLSQCWTLPVLAGRSSAYPFTLWAYISNTQLNPVKYNPSYCKTGQTLEYIFWIIVDLSYPM